MRWLPFLKPGGTFICDTKRIVPPFACLNRHPGAPLRYSKETPAEVIAHVAEAYAIDATAMAEQLGNERAANVVLLGALSTALQFPPEDWERTVAVNLHGQFLFARRAVPLLKASRAHPCIVAMG